MVSSRRLRFLISDLLNDDLVVEHYKARVTISDGRYQIIFPTRIKREERATVKTTKYTVLAASLSANNSNLEFYIGGDETLYINSIPSSIPHALAPSLRKVDRALQMVYFSPDVDSTQLESKLSFSNHICTIIAEKGVANFYVYVGANIYKKVEMPAVTLEPERVSLAISNYGVWNFFRTLRQLKQIGLNPTVAAMGELYYYYHDLDENIRLYRKVVM